ncbi:ACT domain-containing protein [Lactiplantibacillus plantarum]|uniref:ACT domain-containing protein n=1 Tax=Lactiplantibacillus plantarum TaxID=1590 RepID=UPI0013E8F1F2|nr:ACT domain-containing protein [Lactiplantibacillus plantarum]
MKAIITVVGQDQVGIVAKVANELARLKINIVDISQTLMDHNFTMMLSAEWDDQQLSFSAAKEALESLGEASELTIRIQRQAVFDAIQKL